MNYLIYGTSYNLIDEEINKIIGDEKPTIYFLEEVELRDVLEDIGYQSMFDEKKVVILKNFESITSSKKDNEDTVEHLIKYLQDPNPNSILILISNEKINPKSVPKELFNNLQIIETTMITKPYELAKILGDVIKREGYNISTNTLNLFAEKCAANYDIAINEFNKIKKIKGSNKTIDDSDIENHISNYNITDMFGFKDAVINKNIDKALKMLDDLESSKAEIVPLTVMLAKEYQILYNIKLLSNKKMTNDAISKELDNMHTYRVRLLREASNKYSDKELEHVILYLCDLDLKLVTEDNLGFDELRKFLLEL